jgi:hypothetical protein
LTIEPPDLVQVVHLLQDEKEIMAMETNASIDTVFFILLVFILYNANVGGYVLVSITLLA